MDWQVIGIIIGCVSGVGSAFALIFWAGKQFQNLNILWDVYTRFWDFFLFESLKVALSKGWASQSSPWKLTEEGEKVFPEEVKREIEALVPSMEPEMDVGEEAAFLLRKLDPKMLRSLAWQGVSFQEALALSFVYAEQIKSKGRK